MLRAIVAAFLLGLAALPAGAAEETRIARVGVLAFRGGEDALQRWTPTAAYLSAAIPGVRFEIVPLEPARLNAAVGAGEVAFVLTNTGNYVDLEARYGISRIATLRSPSKVSVGNVFGAVIFVRADRQDIRALADLKGKTLLAVQPEGFGGLQMAWRELKAAGVDPFGDLKEVRFSGFPQDQIAFAVLRGEVDAGTFRTGTLEAMEAEGKIKADAFRILAPRSFPGFPFAVSTRLYPEWPFSRLKGTPEDLAQETAIALLRMPADSQAARLGRYGGWTVPMDYSPVHELYRELRLGPYENLGDITIADVIKKYGHWLAAGALVLLVTAAWAARIEQLVARRTRELSRANAELAREVAERRRAEDEARRRQAELAHVHRLNTMGEMASGLAHELNQPLAAIANYARGCVRRLRQGSGDSSALLAAMEQVADQAERAAAIVRRVRGFIRKDEGPRAPLDLGKVVREAVGLMALETDRHGVAVGLDLAENLPPIVGDKVQLEQVILNLLRNGIEAMVEAGAHRRILTVEARPTTEGGVEIAVSDTGPGVGAAERERVFDPFVTSKAEGLGLGLSISRGIVEAHGGRLTVESASGGGARFRFTLAGAAGAARHDAA